MTKKRRGDERVRYQIKVQANLDDRWSDWFDGLTVVVEDESADIPPVTILTGRMDQSALRGILNKIWDLNLTLISIIPID